MSLKCTITDFAKKVYKVVTEEAGEKSADKVVGHETNEQLQPVVAPANMAASEADTVVGDIKVANEVISIVAALAAQEVPGVLAMSAGLVDDVAKLMGKEKAAKGVRVIFDGKMVGVTLFLVVKYGCNIPEVALNVQEHVKKAIEDMANHEVEYVDVHIENVMRQEEMQLKVLEEREA